jgi:beta-lactamase regulating signal transducer with metallopeptidase domain
MTNLGDLVRVLGLDSEGSASVLGVLSRVTILLAVAVLAASVLRKTSAAVRHLVWTLSLAGSLLIPVFAWALPAWRWAVLPPRDAAEQSADASPVLPDRHAAAMPSLATGTRRGDPRAFGQPLGVDEAAASVVPPQQTLVDSARHSWPLAFAVLWGIGTAAGLLSLGIGIWGAWRLSGVALPAAESPWRRLLRQLLAACGFRRTVDVRQCPRISVPMTWGFRRPVILLPTNGDAWSEATQRSVLLHELGHIRRGDCAVHLMGRLACALYWFHPLVWLAARQLRKTSEQAADDAVLASHVAPPDYAEHLVRIAAQARAVNALGLVALPMASPSDLEGRVLAILDKRRNRRSLGRRTCVGLVLLTVLLLIPYAILRFGYALDETPAATDANAAKPSSAAVESNPASNTAQPTVPGKSAEPEGSSLPSVPLASQRVGQATERAIAASLDWLRRHQTEDGHWSLDAFDKQCQGNACSGLSDNKLKSDTAATALALLPFFAAGQTHKSNGPYQSQIDKGIRWLIEQQDSEGDLSGKCFQPMYAHGIATLALCEAYGMTRDSSLEAAAQKAVVFIEHAQNEETGGWRYLPQEAGDTSVFGWQMSALKSAQLAGLLVNSKVFENAHKWLRSVAKGEQHGLYSYQPYGQVTLSMTAVGLLCNQYLGVGHDEPSVQEGVQFLMANLPDSTLNRDAYCRYYATLAIHNFGGQEWEAWNRKMRPMLVDTQIREGCARGSWDPAQPATDTWGTRGGRLMMTTFNALTLEVFYRYLPLFSFDAEQPEKTVDTSLQVSPTAATGIENGE